MTGWWTDVIRVLATIAVVASAGRAIVAFATWRRSLVDRLLGAEHTPPSDAEAVEVLAGLDGVAA